MNKRNAAATVVVLLLEEEEEQQRQKRRTIVRDQWVSPFLHTRQEKGFFKDFEGMLRAGDPKLYKNFVRMSAEDFDVLLAMVGSRISKKDTPFRQAIKPAERLAITLRFLATGDSYATLMFLFRVSRAAISEIIGETCQVLFEELKSQYLKNSQHENSQNNKDLDGGRETSKLLYAINDNPPWYLSIFLAFQHYLTMIGAIVSIPFILTPALCMSDEDPNRGIIISTMIFVTGIVTYVQATWGVRLPIVQGGTISFLVPTLAILALPQWKCPPEAQLKDMDNDSRQELWQVRMRELSGAIAVSAMVQVILGYTGLVGKILKFVTPLTIVPTVSLVGLTLFEHAAETASKHWGIAAGTTSMLTLFSQIMSNVPIPMPVYRKGHGIEFRPFLLFRLFPVLLTIMIMWGLCGVLTLTNVFEEGHPSRTDVRINVLTNAKWFYVPYPGQFGVPSVTLSGVLGMLAGVLACTVESLSYYPTVSQMSGAQSPPLHAINRGIGTEGLGTVLAGLWGAGNGTNTFGENVGAIGVTKIGSRRVIQWAAFIMVLQGVIGKFGAVFILIPDSVVGGIFCVMFGMIIAFGLSTLQYVDLRSARNLYILGLSIFFPMVLCKWIQQHPDAIQTGNDTVNSTLTVLLGTTILVGGLLGCFLDNIIPGTPEERGLVNWAKEMPLGDDNINDGTATDYDFPYGMDTLKRWKWTYYVPFLPTYKLQTKSS